MEWGAPSRIWIAGAFAVCGRFAFFTSAHLWMVSVPTPPSTSMSNEGNWLLNQLTWITRTEKKKRGSRPAWSFLQTDSDQEDCTKKKKRGRLREQSSETEITFI